MAEAAIVIQTHNDGGGLDKKSALGIKKREWIYRTYKN